MSVAGSSSFALEVRFSGYRFDFESGHYDVRNRVYHSTVGWLQRDPLRYADGPSLYSYCSLNPLRFRDPSGAAIQIVPLVILIILLIILAAIIWWKWIRVPFSCEPLTSDKHKKVSDAIHKLIGCLQKAGTGYLGNLARMGIGGRLIEGDPGNANAKTLRGCTCFADSYFNQSQCEQYRTLLWEGLRVAGNDVEEDNAIPYNEAAIPGEVALSEGNAASCMS